MALKISIPDPFGTTNIEDAYAKVAECNLNFDGKYGKITVNIYRDSNSKEVGKQPVSQINISLTPNGEPAKDVDGSILEKQEDGTFKNNKGETVVPTTPPFPSFDQIMEVAVTTSQDATGTPVFDIGKRYLYQLIKSRPEFNGSKDA
jgi:hypothetical protein